MYSHLLDVVAVLVVVAHVTVVVVVVVQFQFVVLEILGNEVLS